MAAPSPTTCAFYPDAPAVERACNCSMPGLVCTESVTADLALPPYPDGCNPAGCNVSSAARPGRRVAEVAPGFAHTRAFHTTFLPADFDAADGARRWPLIVEFSGNGILPQDGNWTSNGWGISAGGRGFVWLTLPFLSADAGARTCNQRNWWGCDPSACDLYNQDALEVCANATLQPNATLRFDPAPTLRYALAAVAHVTASYRVDPAKVLLTGHSRGGIATGYMGLHNDEIAALWTAFAPTSHMDGVKSWSFAPNISKYRAGALQRLRRLQGRPVWYSGECGLATGCGARYLAGTGVDLANFTVKGTQFVDHNSFWALRPDPGGVRAGLRQWVSEVLSLGDDDYSRRS